MSAPNLWRLADLLAHVSTCSASRDGKTWHPARPLGWDSIPARLKIAWKVFTGKADAVIWPGDQ